MKTILVILGLLGLAIGVAQARNGVGSNPVVASVSEREAGWGSWLPGAGPVTPASPTAELDTASPDPQPEVDVVDMHWMALTMWGEARREGESGMRAVAHVIENRRRAGMHGDYVTDTVGRAFQFSCWNPGDPNRAAILEIDRLRPGSTDHRAWLAARRIAAEVMSGASIDPTGGALYYHSALVSPSWAQGSVPVRQIGAHLFYRSAA